MKQNPRYMPPPRPLSAVPADGPPRFRATLRIDVRRFAVRERFGPKFDFSRLDRFAAEQISRLAPGSTIELIVHGYHPVPGYLGFADPRMQWDITADWAEIAGEWRAAIAGASGHTPEGPDAA